MVAIASAAVQASEIERKRKQTLERTRANHLSRQLQMRLQYARLKVDHGWQRQNLNEVENLYFHHSHRGAKMHHPRPSLVVIPSDDNSASFSSLNQLDVAYKTSMSRSATLDALLDISGQRSGMGADGLPASTPTPPAPLRQTGVGSHDPLVTASSTAPEVRECSYIPNQFPSPIPSSMYNERSVPETSSPSDSPSRLTAVTGSATTIINPTPLRSHHFTPASTSFIRTISPPTAVSANQVKMPLLMHKNVSSLAKHDKFGLNKSGNLTYDSFWSGIQSKSYPALNNGGSGLNTGTVNNQLSNNVPNMTTPTITALGTVSTQSLTPNIFTSSTTSPSPLPLIPSHQHHHPPAPSSIPSSHTPAPSLPSASTHIPTFLPQSTSFTPTPQSQQLQLQMQQNRLFIDSLAAWNLIASQQYPGSINAQQNIITGSLVNPTTAYPFLANLSTAYAQAFNAGGEVQGAHTQGNGIGGSDNTTPSPVVPPSNTSSVSSPAPPVASAFVGQDGS